ncbi:MAG: MscL family protein [Candidatus Nanoarchaeia archaeon]|nr:MscL family protein [Candidatus Nanoarchaeia archaeon]
MGLIKEFGDFLHKYEVLGIAIAFVIATASINLINSFVSDIVLPSILPFIPADDWAGATFNIGPVALHWGSFVAQLINFLIIALVVFLIAKSFGRKNLPKMGFIKADSVRRRIFRR